MKYHSAFSLKIYNEFNTLEENIKNSVRMIRNKEETNLNLIKNKLDISQNLVLQINSIKNKGNSIGLH